MSDRRERLQEPLTQLQRDCHERYRRGQAARREAEKYAPLKIARRFGVSTNTIAKAVSGGNVPSLGHENTKKVIELSQKYRELKKLYEKDCPQKLAADFGITERTVYNYGRGRFGQVIGSRATVGNRFEPQGVRGFVTMRLTRCPAESVPGYY